MDSVSQSRDPRSTVMVGVPREDPGIPLRQQGEKRGEKKGKKKPDSSGVSEKHPLGLA